MALTSVFYDGPVTETDRAKNRTGAPDYGVYGPGDFQVTTNGAVPFSTRIKAGRAHGWGVTDTADTDQTLIHDTVASGTRWDLVVVRRNWQPLLGGPSTLVAIKGGAFTDIPAGRKVGPGVEDDQPIALVGWKAGQTAPFQIIDLRCWASNGGMEVASEICFEYLGRPGTCVRFDGTTWRYSRQANGAWGWVPDVAPVRTFGFVQPSGWKLEGECRVSDAGNGTSRVDMDVNIIRTGATVSLGTTFTSFGAILSNNARGGSGGVKYLPIAISGGSAGNNKLAMAYVNTSSGQVGIRSTEGVWGWQSGANATLNITYYI